ncbi:unnamed protein product [Spodoptera littoralis]|uniref:Uncharacterized protein n=1 Tax=Spodoptera littoralis TaxID=7109 RepID=A0A9P0IA77_SPOLI|nr:unnamed protein product [Spodoptera littoralis]
MGSDEVSVQASVAHIVLCCVAGRGISQHQGKCFTHPGMHANFFIHGILGFLHFQSNLLNNDFNAAYLISLHATRYLALPCLNADLRNNDQALASAHVLSGVIPFALALAGQDNIVLGNLVIACNIISLCHYSLQNNREWGWFTAAAGVLAYFLSPATKQKMLYPLTLGLMEYCAYRVFTVHFAPPPPPQGRR